MKKFQQAQPHTVRGVLVDVFTILEELSDGQDAAVMKLSQEAATNVVFEDLDICESGESSYWETKAILVGAVLADARMNKKSLQEIADENDLRTYLMKDTILGTLTDEQWNAI